MLHYISETILAIASYIPAQFVEQDSPRFGLIRTMFALLLVVLLMALIAWWQLRSAQKHHNSNGGAANSGPDA